jgi:hypothetical protein
MLTEAVDGLLTVRAKVGGEPLGLHAQFTGNIQSTVEVVPLRL